MQANVTGGALAELSSIPGLVRAETVTPAGLIELCSSLSKRDYSHEEIFGQFCFLAEHIDVPYGVVFDYCADPMSLTEWTINIRNLKPDVTGLYRGNMIFSKEDADCPSTEIFIRADAMKGREHGTICYPCAWDQGDELWMRYYFTFADARVTLNRPGTLVFWVNCKHPYYDRKSPGVPLQIRRGMERTDRPWAGDGWPLFYPLHRIELSNLKRILEHRSRASS
jgi:hypothetical protein